MDELALID